MSDLRLESLRAWRDLENYNVPEGQWFQPTASEVASVLSDADLWTEIVRRGETTYWPSCAACLLDACHVGPDGKHRHPTEPDAIHRRDVWLLSPFTEDEYEALETE